MSSLSTDALVFGVLSDSKIVKTYSSAALRKRYEMSLHNH